jgi:class 3 adenylate cyclase/predicted ATPase
LSLDVRSWLETNGFGQYADLFEAQRIDTRALTGLTDQHLREMGIPLGPRLNLLAALARLSSPSGSSMAERRRLTVMFVDLVGSTELSYGLDPEDLGRVIRGYQDVVDRVVTRYDAHVAQYTGDGVMVYFGYPSAHEDDAERAVRSALAIMRDIAKVRVPGGAELGARIGIATGLVVVGDLIGGGEAREHAVGQTPNLAARLQVLAKPGEIIVSDRTRELIGGSFELRDLGRQQLKGIALPVVAYSVTGERDFESRFDAQRASRVAAMVGRVGELELLRDRWRAATLGEGRLVLLVGEAGIGKSRILRALQDSLALEPPLVLYHQCSPYHAGSALYPPIQQLTRAAQISPGDTADMRLDRLESLLAGASATDIALIAALLGIDGTQRYGALDLTPQQHRLRTFDALMNQLARLALSRPVLWVLEDAHWIDPTTLELVQRYIDQVGEVRALAVVTARPDFKHDFGTHRNLTRIELNRLGPIEITAMVDGVTGGKPLPERLIAEIVSKSDGVPLFVEEFTKSMLESGVVRETENEFVFDGTQQMMTVPASLHDSLMARLDRLQPYKEIAQTAACIGREFGYGLLASVYQGEDRMLFDALARLEDARLIYRRSGTQEPQYAFKHALVRDAAYESLLRANREKIHARLVTALERLPDSAPEIIAQHAAHARMNEKAIQYWQKAAAAAAARPAYKEAIAHLTQAISLAEAMGDDLSWQERRLMLWMALAQATIPLYGYSHSQTVSIFKHARGLAAAVGKGPHRFSILHATWAAHYVRGEQDSAFEAAQSMLEFALGDASDGHRLSALRALGISQMMTGTPERANGTFEQAGELATVLRQRSHERRNVVADRFAADPAIATQFHVGLTLWSLGRIDEGCTLAEEAIAAARTMGHAHTLAHAVTHGAIFAVLCHDIERALNLSSETIELANKHDMELWKGYGLVLQGFALALRGEFAESVRSMEPGFASIALTQTGAMIPLHHAMHCRALAALGRFDEAQHHADVVGHELKSGSERYLWPECRRLLGDYLCLCPSTDRSQIEAAYTEALDLARRQGARTWQLYTATSLARFWIEQGERLKAIELLAPLHASFSQGQHLPIYKQAASILALQSRAQLL